ncbi:hypothetical protein T12_7043, partial [Trichinella patagoniensis]
LMKGATPNKLVKGVTANQMSIIGIETEPDVKSHSGVQCYRLHIWDHSFTKWTESSLESRSSQHGNLCNETQPWGPPFKGRGARGGAGAVELGLTLFPRRQASGTAT